MLLEFGSQIKTGSKKSMLSLSSLLQLLIRIGLSQLEGKSLPGPKDCKALLLRLSNNEHTHALNR